MNTLFWFSHNHLETIDVSCMYGPCFRTEFKLPAYTQQALSSIIASSQIMDGWMSRGLPSATDLTGEQMGQTRAPLIICKWVQMWSEIINKDWFGIKCTESSKLVFWESFTRSLRRITLMANISHNKPGPFIQYIECIIHMNNNSNTQYDHCSLYSFNNYMLCWIMA